MTLFWVNYNAAVINGWWWWWLPPIVVIGMLFISLFLIAPASTRSRTPRLRRTGASESGFASSRPGHRSSEIEARSSGHHGLTRKTVCPQCEVRYAGQHRDRQADSPGRLLSVVAAPGDARSLRWRAPGRRARRASSDRSRGSIGRSSAPRTVGRCAGSPSGRSAPGKCDRTSSTTCCERFVRASNIVITIPKTCRLGFRLSRISAEPC